MASPCSSQTTGIKNVVLESTSLQLKLMNHKRLLSCTNLVWLLSTAQTTHKHNTDLLAPYKGDMVSLLANSCLFTHVANMEWDYRAKYLPSFLVLTSYWEQDLSLSLLDLLGTQQKHGCHMHRTNCGIQKTLAENSHIVYKLWNI